MTRKRQLVIGIHPDRFGEESFSDKWCKFLEARGAEPRVLDLLAADALEQARQCDGIMWRWAHNPQDKQSAQRILFAIEHCLHIPVFPDSRTAWHYDEKIGQFYLLQILDAPTPRSWLFWDRKKAVDWAREAPYPIVFKLSSGAGSSNVIKVETEADAMELIRRSFGRGIFPYTMNEFHVAPSFPFCLKEIRSQARRVRDALAYIWCAEYPPLPLAWWRPERGYAYFQEFLPGNDFDTRITVLGDRAFGFRRLNRPGDFRASGSGLIEYDPTTIDVECIRIAFEISTRGAFQSMAYDFLYKAEHPVICEISYTFADWAVYACPGHWNSDLEWIEGQMWPEEAHVADFLKLLDDRK